MQWFHYILRRRSLCALRSQYASRRSDHGRGSFAGFCPSFGGSSTPIRWLSGCNADDPPWGSGFVLGDWALGGWVGLTGGLLVEALRYCHCDLLRHATQIQGGELMLRMAGKRACDFSSMLLLHLVSWIECLWFPFPAEPAEMFPRLTPCKD